MKKLNLLALLLGSVFALGACGSSGGGSGSSAQPNTGASAGQNVNEQTQAAAILAQAKQDVAAALKAAETARTTADAAVQTAAQAKTAAETAKNAALKAKTAADRAAAEKAKTDADRAAASAAKAQTDADQAAAHAKAQADKARQAAAKTDDAAVRAEAAKVQTAADAAQAAAEQTKAHRDTVTATVAQTKTAADDAIAAAAAAANTAGNTGGNNGNNNGNNSADNSGAAANPTVKAVEDELKKTFIANHKDKDKADWMAHNPINGAVLTINNQTGSVRAALPDSQEIESITINGNKVLLLARSKDSGTRARKLNGNDFPGGTVIGTGFVGSTPYHISSPDFQDFRWGVHTHDGISTVFVQGKPSSFMPKSGASAYTGKAVVGKEGDYSLVNVQVEADFDTKNVNVVMKDLPYSKFGSNNQLEFGGTIMGNTFAGTRNGIVSKGGFYGGAAASVAGVFYGAEGEKQGVNGAFGASEKKSIRKK
ncbi:hypothetical protein [Conchiformibius kuhniae]|uniref:Transferrin-binding protein-like solute binding protein n=1 Tax=Conchiformibius kuhniae TaxID=211502 RepID=A0ABD8B6W3_9NEIS|nr:hypothetical protein [Conchiformibius kuhniae]